MQSKRQDYQKIKTREISQRYKKYKPIFQETLWYCEVS